MSRLGAAALSVDLDSDRYDWRDYGACVGNTEIDFFPNRGKSTREAKAICAQCPVKDICLEAALRNGEKFGIWGGLSERERRRARRARRIEGVAPKVNAGDRVLAELGRRGGEWWTTVEGIARTIGCEVTTARQVVGVLRRHELITVTKRRDGAGGSSQPSIVAIHLNEGTTP